MNCTRIRKLIDVERLARSHVTVVGTGGGANLCRNLVRCSVGAIALVDFDRVEAVNICRQEHPADAIGQLKVDTLTTELQRIDAAVQVERHARDFCTFSDEEIDRYFGKTDLFVFAVDNLPACARGNEVALRLGKPVVFSGVYAKGAAGEIAFWHPGLDACFRCLCSARYRAFAEGPIVTNPADSADVLSVQLIDSIAGMVALGLLTRGADNFYGRLIDRLGDRNFLQVKIGDWTWNGRDIFAEHLGIAADCPAYFSFVTIARSDPDHGQPPCPDCVAFRGRQAVPTKAR